MDYKEAFRVSNIWYFRKVIDSIGVAYVQDTLDRLQYGNCDIGAWEGSRNNLLFPNQKDWKELNGFWQEASLEISPREQVDIVMRIFEDKDIFLQENIDLMKEIMLIEEDDNIKIYGKTGSGKKNASWSNAWFVGMFEKNEEATYFAVRLNQPEAIGSQAKEVAINIINGEFRNP